MVTLAQKKETNLQPMSDSSRKAKIIEAVGNYEIAKDAAAWSELDLLSTDTEFDGLEAVPEGVFSAGDNAFEAVATVYVKLHYGDSDGDVSAPETFAANVRGHIEDDEVVIEDVKIDTTAFHN